VNGFDKNSGAVAIVELAPVITSVFYMQVIVDGRAIVVDFREFAEAYRGMMDAWAEHPDAAWKR